MVSASSDAHTPRNISCPVSPTGSPLLHSRSPPHVSGRMSPSPISSPCATSGSSTPLTGGSGAIPFHYLKQPANYLHDGIGMVPRSQNSLYPNGSTCYQDPKPGLFRGMPQVPHVFREEVSSENDIIGSQFGRPVHGDPWDHYYGQSALADRVSQQLLRDHAKLNPTRDLNPGSPMLGRTNGI